MMSQAPSTNPPNQEINTIFTPEEGRSDKLVQNFRREHKKLKTLLIGLGTLVLVIGLATVVTLVQQNQDIRQQAVLNPVDLTFNPTSLNPQVDEDITLDLILHTNDYQVSAVNLAIEVDDPNNAVDFVSLTPADLFDQPTTPYGALNETTLIPGQFNTTTNTATLTLGVPCDLCYLGSDPGNGTPACQTSPPATCYTTATDTTGTVARLTLRTIAPGTATLSFGSDSQVSARGSDINVVGTLDSTATITVTGVPTSPTPTPTPDPNLLTVCPDGSPDATCDYTGTSGIQSAIDTVPAGGTVLVKAGTYTEAGPIYLAKTITVTGEGLGTNLVGNANEMIFLIQGAFQPTITDLSLSNAGGTAAISIEGSAKPTITRNRISSSTRRGIFITNGSAVIKNNIIRDNTEFGIDISSISEPALITNNTIINNSDTGIFLYPTTPTAEVTNNITFGNAGYGIRGTTNTTFSRLENNLSFNNTLGNYNDFPNWPPATNLEVDPLFIDAATNNFLLEYSSPARNAGDSAVCDPWGTLGGEACTNDTTKSRSNIGTYGGPDAKVYGDISVDGGINGGDYVIIFSNWGQSPPSDPRADINGDGTVNGGDYVIIFSKWGTQQ